MFRIEITSKLSESERKRLARILCRYAEYEPEGIHIRPVPGSRTAFCYLTAGPGDEDPLGGDPHRAARRIMTVLGRTFDYTVRV